MRKFSYMRFEPEGITGNPEIPFAKSMPDYIMRWLASRFIDDVDYLESLGILTTRSARGRKPSRPSRSTTPSPRRTARATATRNGRRGDGADEDGPRGRGAHRHPAGRPGEDGSRLELGPACDQCGGMMQRTGSCYTCSSCGNNTGCG